MNEILIFAESAGQQGPARIVAGALAHLAAHLSTGCPRAAWLAAMLLEGVAGDPAADSHLRNHARELAEVLERDPLTLATPQSRRVDRRPAPPLAAC